MANSAAFKTAIQTAEKEPRKTRTTNGAKAYTQTGEAVLNYFSKVGARRGQDNYKLFVDAMTENEDLALRALLWTRDIRGGAGERATFRSILTKLAVNQYETAARLLHKVPELGRWDDLLVLVGTPLEKEAFSLIAEGLRAENGLAAKWMPRKGEVAAKLRAYMGLTPKQYRKLLVGLTNVVETQMCNKEWRTIEFGKVPSVASQVYRKAFFRNAEEQYTAYLNSLTKGEAKVNAGAVYPHTVIGMFNSYNVKPADIQLANAQWEALPNFVPEGSSVLPMIDSSGSMGCPAGGSSTVRCYDVAAGLGMYLATKNTGAFKDCWLNFSTNPTLQTLKGKTVYEKYTNLDRDNWDASTNLEAAFALILKVAKKNNVKQEDMPKTLMIFSDMQFNRCVFKADKTLFKNMKQQYKAAGYEVPNVVFWNLNDCGNSPAKFNDAGVALVSGFSPSLMKNLLNNNIENMTPYNMMLDVLMQDRYAV